MEMDWSEKSIEVLNLWSRLTEYNPLSSKNRRQKMVPISNTKGRMPNVTASSTHTTSPFWVHHIFLICQAGVNFWF